MTEAPLRAELLLDREVPDGLPEELAAALGGIGVRVARTRRAIDHRGPAELPWLVLLSLPLQAFLSGLGAEAVKDSYQAFKKLVQHVLGRSGPSAADGEPLPLVLQDDRSGLRVVLEPGLPAEAYEQLLALDLTCFRCGPLHYDRQLGRWRAELDEAEDR